MADVVASSTNPTVTFKNTTSPPAGGHEYWREVAPGAVLSFDYQPITPLAWTTKMTLDGSGGTELTLSGSSPTLVFEDTTASAHDFQLKANADALVLTDNTGPETALTISGASASLVLEDTTTSPSAQDDFRITAEDNELKIIREDSAPSTLDLLTLTDTGTTSHVDLTVSSTAPTLTFEDTTGSALGFDLHVESDALEVRNDGGTVLIEVTQAGVFTLCSSTTGDEFQVDPHLAVGADHDCLVDAGIQGTTRGRLRARRDATQSDTRMGVLVLQDKDGTDWFVWVNRNSGTPLLMMDSTDPVANEVPGSAIVIGP